VQNANVESFNGKVRDDASTNIGSPCWRKPVQFTGQSHAAGIRAGGGQPQGIYEGMQSIEQTTTRQNLRQDSTRIDLQTGAGQDGPSKPDAKVLAVFFF